MTSSTGNSEHKFSNSLTFCFRILGFITKILDRYQRIGIQRLMNDDIRNIYRTPDIEENLLDEAVLNTGQITVRH